MYKDMFDFQSEFIDASHKQLLEASDLYVNGSITVISYNIGL